MMKDILRDSARIGIKRINITGGEPLLHKESVFEVISSATSLGLRVTLISNGFWGRSLPEARRIVEQFLAAGLAELHLSADRFHLRFIPMERLENILTACAEQCLSNYVFVSEIDNDDIAERIKKNLSAFDARLIPQDVLPNGPNGAWLLEKYALRSTPRPRDMPCQGPLNPLVDPAGNVFLCCSPLDYVTDSPFRLGTIDESLERALYGDAFKNRLAHFIVMYGPLTLAREVGRTSAKKGFRWKRRYYGSCDLCKQMFCRKPSCENIREFIEGYSPPAILSRTKSFFGDASVHLPAACGDFDRRERQEHH